MIEIKEKESAYVKVCEDGIQIIHVNLSEREKEHLHRLVDAYNQVEEIKKRLDIHVAGRNIQHLAGDIRKILSPQPQTVGELKTGQEFTVKSTYGDDVLFMRTDERDNGRWRCVFLSGEYKGNIRYISPNVPCKIVEEKKEAPCK